MKTSWSFSRLTEYERCPHTQSFPYRHQEPTPAAKAGIDAHKVCENWIKFGGRNDSCPEFDGFDWNNLVKINPFTEIKLGLNESWQKTPYKEAWLKIIIDALTPDFTTIIDYKIGRREYNDVKHIQQMQLYACAVDAIYKPTEVPTELWYLGEGHIKASTYTPEKLVILRPKFHARAERMLNDKTLSPKPSKSNCRFCSHKDICEFAFEP
jgi:hypothetical protein